MNILKVPNEQPPFSTESRLKEWLARLVVSINLSLESVTQFKNEFDNLTTTDVPEGTNLYFTNARARTAAVQDAIVDGVANIAPSQNAVFDSNKLLQDQITYNNRYFRIFMLR
jgi:hypothetical protein